MQIKEHYVKFAKKYNLPKFEELDSEFEIGKIDTKLGFYFKDISRAINNKIGYFAGLLEPTVNPPIPTIHSMVETSNIDKNEKEDILKLYKKLLFLAHKGYTLEAVKDENKVAEFIKDIWKVWPELREEMFRSMKIITEAWVKIKEQETEGRSYTG